MQDDNPLANEKAVEGSTDARTTARSKFEQAVTKSPRVRKPETRPMFDKQFYQACVVGEDVHGLRLDVMQYSLMKVLDLEGHEGMLANTRTRINGRYP